METNGNEICTNTSWMLLRESLINILSRIRYCSKSAKLMFSQKIINYLKINILSLYQSKPLAQILRWGFLFLFPSPAPPWFLFSNCKIICRVLRNILLSKWVDSSHYDYITFQKTTQNILTRNYWQNWPPLYWLDYRPDMILKLSLMSLLGKKSWMAP